MREDLARLTARREELQSLLAGRKEEPVRLHPGMAGHYRVQVANLVEVLNHEDNRAEAAEIFRSLVERITLTPNSDGKLDIHFTAISPES